VDGQDGVYLADDCQLRVARDLPAIVCLLPTRRTLAILKLR